MGTNNEFFVDIVSLKIKIIINVRYSLLRYNKITEVIYNMKVLETLFPSQNYHRYFKLTRQFKTRFHTDELGVVLDFCSVDR